MPALLANGQVTPVDVARIRDMVAAFLRRRSKQELIEAAVQHKFMAAPIFTIADLAESPHLAARDFWREGMDGRRYPSFPARFTGHDLRTSLPAPRLGQHNHEIFGGELGLRDADLTRLRDSGVIA
jgi:crotonobetainyl-CoA:carnitine CoA-transferase CaiB-like acyl-CoA transferase